MIGPSERTIIINAITGAADKTGEIIKEISFIPDETVTVQNPDTGDMRVIPISEYIPTSNYGIPIFQVVLQYDACKAVYRDILDNKKYTPHTEDITLPADRIPLSTTSYAKLGGIQEVITDQLVDAMCESFLENMLIMGLSLDAPESDIASDMMTDERNVEPFLERYGVFKNLGLFKNTESEVSKCIIQKQSQSSKH